MSRPSTAIRVLSRTASFRAAPLRAARSASIGTVLNQAARTQKTASGITPGHHLLLHLNNPCMRHPVQGNRQLYDSSAAFGLEIPFARLDAQLPEPKSQAFGKTEKTNPRGAVKPEMADARSANREVPDNRFFNGLPLTPRITFPIGSTTGAMKQLRNTVIRAGLGALYFSGAYFLLRPIFSGVGAVFMLHHVRPGRDGDFQPNRHLEVTPDFLRTTLTH